MRRMISALLCAVMILTAMSSAMAEERESQRAVTDDEIHSGDGNDFSAGEALFDETLRAAGQGNEDFKYTVKQDGTAEITAYKGSAAQLEIPGQIGSLTVTGIADHAFRANDRLKEVTLPDSVTSVGDDAFAWCSNLTTVTLPKSLLKIGRCAFEYCRKLESILIPEGVTAIESRAFEGCSSLKSVLIPDTVTQIGSGAFMSCSSLTSVKLPKDLRTIESLQFYGCGSLSDVVIPDGVKEIRNHAFFACSALTELSVPNGVNVIGSSAFAHCGSLISISIPRSVIRIDSRAFSVLSDEQLVPNPKLTLIVEKNSYAEKYAKENGFKYSYASGDRTNASDEERQAFTITVTFSQRGQYTVEMINGLLSGLALSNVSFVNENGYTITHSVTRDGYTDVSYGYGFDDITLLCEKMGEDGFIWQLGVSIFEKSECSIDDNFLEKWEKANPGYKALKCVIYEYDSLWAALYLYREASTVNEKTGDEEPEQPFSEGLLPA